jgi:hypothetical protein
MTTNVNELKDLGSPENANLIAFVKSAIKSVTNITKAFGLFNKYSIVHAFAKS